MTDQLVVYHSMLPPGMDHVGEGCAMFVDQLPHLSHGDVEVAR
jgi:predicted dithiol-disulfide oxidoreductase (DUF899 family)